MEQLPPRLDERRNPRSNALMKFLSFMAGTNGPRVGGLDSDGHIVDFIAAAQDFPASMLDLIRSGDTAVEHARELLSSAPSAARLAPADVRLTAPIPRPLKNVFCVGRNYKEHVEEGYRARGTEVAYPKAPQFFTKAPTTVIGPNDVVFLDPAVTQKFDYEAELGVVIGSGGKNISETRALDAVFGYTIVNDLTARDLQRHHDQWFKGKSLDRSCATGPWIVHRSAIGDPQDLGITLKVNGELRQESRTSNMIFSIAKIISDLSLGMTLEPGDIIATGTPQGVGYAMDPPCYLADGDEIVIEIEQIGLLRNRIEEV